MRLSLIIFVILFMMSQLVAGSQYNPNRNRTKSEDFHSEVIYFDFLLAVSNELQIIFCDTRFIHRPTR